MPWALPKVLAAEIWDGAPSVGNPVYDNPVLKRQKNTPNLLLVKLYMWNHFLKMVILLGIINPAHHYLESFKNCSAALKNRKKSKNRIMKGWLI